MAESLIIEGTTKEEKYKVLFPQLEALVSGEDDAIANMANISACLMDTFHFLWVGFYRVVNTSNLKPLTSHLILGPFQGPLACTRIKKGRGVCGTAWERGETVIVPDVDKFPGHIACSSASRSEIVVPLIKGSSGSRGSRGSRGEVTAVLDIDSDQLDTFDETDKFWLEKIAKLLVN